MVALTGLVAFAATASAPAQPTAICLGKAATIVGTEGADVIRGTDRRDVIVGLGGNDTIDGLDFADTICGGDGDDVISPGLRSGQEEDREADTISGDAGDDQIAVGDEYRTTVSFEEAPGPVEVNLSTHRATGWGNDRLGSGLTDVRGSRYSDSITGDDSYNWLSGGPGDDRLFGLDTSDVLEGGEGDDTLDGGKQRRNELNEDVGDLASYAEAPRRIVADLASGRATGWGNDRLVEIEFVEGSPYADRLLGGPGPDFNFLFGNAGDDVLLGRGGIDALWGGGGDDLLVGGPGNAFDNLRGDGPGRTDSGKVRPGNDRLRGGGGGDELHGEGGRDSLEGGQGRDQLDGGPGDDGLDGGAGVDWIYYEWAPRRVVASLATGRVSGWGQDRLTGIENLIGSRFADRVFGSPRNDGIYGRYGADFISGAGGNDTLFGENDNDRIRGGSGRDTLAGGPGRDRLDGGTGRDLCVGGERRRACP